MKPGLLRFEYQLNALDKILSEAADAASPAEVLLARNARTAFFMGEGLCRVYAKMQDKKLFDRLREEFKEPEDLLGAIDYWDFFAGDFEKDPFIPSTARMFAEAQRAEKVNELNKYLKDRKWLDASVSRAARIRKKLQEVKWQSEETEISSLHKIYERAIEKIEKFYALLNGKFTDPEADLHELRRKLRWLSIYPHALRGAIQLEERLPANKTFEKYLTPAVLNSPYNKFPEPAGLSKVLLLDRNSFYALSWLIAELGTLKDACLRVEAGAAATAGTQFMKPEEAHETSVLLNALSGYRVDESLRRAESLCAEFFREGHLQNLLP